MTVEEIRIWLVSKVAEQTEIDPHKIGVSEPFTAYGLVSIDAVMLSGELEELVGRRLSAALFYDYPTIEALATHLAEQSEDGGAGPKARPEAVNGGDLLSDILAEIEPLSEAEAEALLEKQALTPRERKNN